MVTRIKALQILDQHGFDHNQPTAAWPHLRDAAGQMIYDPDSTFDKEVGIRDSYTIEEIRNWLGY